MGGAHGGARGRIACVLVCFAKAAGSVRWECTSSSSHTPASPPTHPTHPPRRVVAGDAESYRYLVESIRMFPDQETWARQVEGAGFRGVDYENLTAGVVAIHSGFKV